MRFVLGAAALLALGAGMVACGDDDDEDDGSPTTGTTVTATATTGATNTPEPSPTTPATTRTATAGATTTPPPAEGTIDPLNAGQTEDWPVKPNPDPAAETARLVEVRLGIHPEEGGWERIVFEFEGTQLPEGTVGYVEDPTQCGSGQAVELDGEAVLGIRFVGTDAHDEAGQVTVNVTEFEGPGNTIIEGEQACDFEAHVEWYLGMKGEQNFKVTTLTEPTRLVVDVKQ